MERDSNNTFLVTFPDIPEAVSMGHDEDEALLNALDALESAIKIYFDEKREVPPPSKPKKDKRSSNYLHSWVRRYCLQTRWSVRGGWKSELARRLVPPSSTPLKRRSPSSASNWKFLFHNPLRTLGGRRWRFTLHRGKSRQPYAGAPSAVG
nr:type II toxin-antitoxin system HicB family antitoxin [Caballeronia sp. dw_276]